ncbi:SURF1 family protein [Halomonadaceae bacterium KBTZ08]
MATTVLVALLIGLGVWQLNRGFTKAERQDRWSQSEAPVEWPVEAPLEGQPVALSGHYDQQIQWLLDNRTREGRPGYEVLQPFHTGDGPVLVNRGWVPAPDNRDRLPRPATPEGSTTLEGRVWDWPEPLVLGPVDAVNPDGWPRRVASLSRSQARSTLPGVAGVPIRLVDDRQPGARRTGWEPDRMDAATHYGYAVQWFGLALVLLSLTIAISFRRDEES